MLLTVLAATDTIRFAFGVEVWLDAVAPNFPALSSRLFLGYLT